MTTEHAEATNPLPDDADTAVEADGEAVNEEPTSVETTNRRGVGWARVLVVAVLLTLALGAVFLGWHDWSIRRDAVARVESVQAAKDATIALLSYHPDTVEKELGAARDLLTGDFKNAYTSLTDDVVIPGAKQKQITAVASVPAAASVSADPKHCVALVFVNQTVVVGGGAPTDTASSVKVSLDKVDGRWLISGFDPI